MKASNPLYNELRQEYLLVWNDLKIVDHCLNKIQVAVQLTDGSIITFDKPTIHKEFCFGWNTFGNDYDDAIKAARGIGKSKKYFLHQNLDYIDSCIQDIKETGTKLYIHDHYRSDVKIKDYVLLRHDNQLWMYNNPRLSDTEGADRQLLLAALQTLRTDFAKKLETWWKKYGADHIVTWTYCQDD